VTSSFRRAVSALGGGPARPTSLGGKTVVEVRDDDRIVFEAGTNPEPRLYAPMVKLDFKKLLASAA